MQAWPRSGINSSLFNWSVVHGYSWKSTAHINALELQAVLNSVKWRLRKQHREPYRALHLIDSQVVCAIITKGRTSSYRLRRGLKQLNALLLASGMVLIIGYVNTDCNPSGRAFAMGRKALEPHQREQRKQSRAGTTLKSQMVSPGMQSRYRRAVLVVLSFLTEARIQVSAWSELDSAVGIWLEYAYSEGEHKSLASDALAGLQHFVPQSVGLLKHSWKTCKSVAAT